ncbi:MAG TPA: lysylphosphatidylglycerol synthase domain-containing protein [Gemmatimonadaceae bacterium]|nr:lysylphosphatidylglycerol synthase domain-containing protein [Gemmatimonadaceae bacterium]HRQ78807.1 lysylphosphatidylglycerol synthase domain-containing protein [Gemmatimonadaceae bacterium]
MARWIVALSALGLLIRYVGASDVLVALQAIHPLAVLIYTVAFALVPFIYAVQVSGALRRLGHPVSRELTMRATVHSWSVGTLTPARAGDLSLAFFLGSAAPALDATAIVIVDKLVSLVVLALLAIVSVIVVQAPYATAFAIGTSWVLGGICAVLALVAVPARGASSGSLARRVLGVPGAETWDRIREIVTKRGLLRWSLTMALVRWGYVCAANLLLFWGTGARPGFGTVVAATAIGRIISLIPVSIGGLGVKEPLQIVLYAGAGVPAKTVIAVSVIGMGCGLLAASLVPLLVRVPRPVGEGR